MYKWYESRYFYIDRNPAHGGVACSSSPETRERQMPTTTTPSPMPIDCKGVWGAWSKCTNGMSQDIFTSIETQRMVEWRARRHQRQESVKCQRQLRHHQCLLIAKVCGVRGQNVQMV